MGLPGNVVQDKLSLMSPARKFSRMSVDEYLAGEVQSQVKHEYVGGAIYAMVGGRNAHNLIATNSLVALGKRLSGKPRRPFNSDTKIRIHLPSGIRFYYPDVSVICHQNPQKDLFQDEPAVIIEVLSRSTRRIDEGEKKEAYLTIQSLTDYILVEQESPTITVWRRSGSTFEATVYHGLDSAVPLDEIGVALPLSEVFDSVELSVESEY